MRSYVLRVAADALAERRVVGRIEAVETGDGAPICSADELLEFLYRRSRATPARPAGGEASRPRAHPDEDAQRSSCGGGGVG
jgi:hypothetical protein